MLSVIKTSTNWAVGTQHMQDFFNSFLNSYICDFSETWRLQPMWTEFNWGVSLADTLSNIISSVIDNHRNTLLDLMKRKQTKQKTTIGHCGRSLAFRKNGVLREHAHQWLYIKGSHPLQLSMYRLSLSRKYRKRQWLHRKETESSPFFTSTCPKGWRWPAFNHHRIPTNSQYSNLELNSSRLAYGQ